MRIRTIYYKVTPTNWDASAKFWSDLLGIRPAKLSPRYTSFPLDGINFVLLLNDFEEPPRGSNCVPVFELADNEITAWVARADTLGATVVLDGLDDPNMRSIVMADPFGNEFEISRERAGGGDQQAAAGETQTLF